jgi:hypothetical protein
MTAPLRSLYCGRYGEWEYFEAARACTVGLAPPGDEGPGRLVAADQESSVPWGHDATCETLLLHFTSFQSRRAVQ